MNSVDRAQQKVIDEQIKIIQEQSKIIDQKANEAERYRKIAHGQLKDGLTPEEIENIYLTSHAGHRLHKQNFWYILIDILWGFQIFATIISMKEFDGAWTGGLMICTVIAVIVGIVKMVKSNIVARKCIADGQISMSKSIREKIRLTLILCTSSFLSFITLMMIEVIVLR